jgi:hypothetical protein
MSELATFDDMTIEAIEVACQSAFEECESVFRAIDSKKNQLEIFGRLLTAAKKKVSHGEWENWLTDTFHGRLPFRTAQRWMATAKAPEVALLKSDKAEHVPRAERKTGRVKVEHAANQSADVNEKVDTRPVDDDPNPAPKTNTKHSPATAKAKESDRPVPAVVTPEIVTEPAPAAVDPVQEWIRSHSLGDLVSAVVDQLEDDAAKRKAAAELRKLADKLDPPKVDKTPSKSQLVAMIPEDWAPELARAAADWAEYKQARAKGERIQTVRAWELALEKFTSQPSKTVISKVNKAIENSWKGWDHDAGNGTTSTARSGNRRGLTAEEVFS